MIQDNLMQAIQSFLQTDPFIRVIKEADIDELDKMFMVNPEDTRQKIIANNFLSFRQADQFGHLHIMDRLMTIVPDAAQEMIKALNPNITDNSVSLDFADFKPVIDAVSKFSPEMSELIRNPKFLNSVLFAMTKGYITFLELLLILAPEKVKNIMRTENIDILIEMSHSGHLPVFERLIALIPDNFQYLLHKDEFSEFQMMAQHGQLHQIESYIAFSSDIQILAMIEAHNFRAFRWAALNGHINIVDKLFELAPSKIKDMISADNYIAFQFAAEKGHNLIIERLLTHAPEKAHEILFANNCLAFRLVCLAGHLEILNKFTELLPDEIESLLSANNYGPLKGAAMNGHLVIIERLITLAQDRVQEMVIADNYLALESAARNGHTPVINRLISFPIVFAHAEMHIHEYGQYVHEFMGQQFTALNKNKADFEASNPIGVFDITDTEQARLYYYMIRHLIRNKRPESIEQIHLLLSIPSVRVLAHQEVSANEPNELLRLALSLNHREEAQMLLLIPAVYDLAERNDFYHQEQIFGIDFQATAQDLESSMRALTQGEEKVLERAILKYQPEINQYGEKAIMDDLKQFLVKRFEANPAKVQNEDGQMIALPINFDEFETLAKTFSTDDIKAQAFENYYQHPVHTAYRYLSKPNHWVYQQASYLNRNEEGAWSTFEEYQSLISLFYLAAKDETIEAVNGWTIEGRVEHFIQEIGLIGRAHNWDKQRLNLNTNCMEEYDDLEGDKPSCYSGVKRRLFQSVQGHPLLSLLTKDMILQEVISVVRKHFISRINDENNDELLTAWEMIFEGGSDDANILQQLNFTEEEQAFHIASISKDLHEKYDFQFTPELEAYLVSRLKIGKHFKNLAEQYGAQTGLLEILSCQQEKRASKPSFR